MIYLLMIFNLFKKNVKESEPTLTFLPCGKKVTVQPGTTVLEAALVHDIDLSHSCGGQLACSSCHIYVESTAASEAANPISDEEDDMLDSANHAQKNSRLACQVKVYTNLIVRVPIDS
ncbi:MAG: 2Fe-2S iron-sulfur cluster-binding protein [Mariprofundaceae bacterium]